MGEQSVGAAVMPHLLQPGTGEHPTHGSTAGLRDQPDNQPDEGVEGGCGEARAERCKQTGQRARVRWGRRHRRRIALTRTVTERSMLSSSPSKIHEPLAVGVSPRLTGRRQRQKTAKHEPCGRVLIERSVWTVLDHDQEVEAAQEDGVDVGEVDREDSLGFRGDELSPGRSGPSRGGIEAGFLEDRPDGGRGDRMAEADQFALDSSVPHVGFSWAIRSTSARMDCATGGRPGCRRG